MTALGTVVKPVVTVLGANDVSVAWTQVANADQYTIEVYPKVPHTSTDYDLEDDTAEKTVARVAGTGATTQRMVLEADSGNPTKQFKVTVIAHQISGANTDSESAASDAFTIGVQAPGAASSGEVAHATVNPFTGLAFASAGQTKGQVSYTRNADGTISQTADDATTSEGATAAARDTADLPNGDMQQTRNRDEGDLQAGEGGGKTLMSDLVLVPSDLVAAGVVTVDPVTRAMTVPAGTEDTTNAFPTETSIFKDRVLHEIDHTKNTVDKNGVASA